METEAALSVLAIASAAVIAPLLSELLSRWRIPSVLFEILLGIIIGPSLLGWVTVGGFVQGLSDFGLAILFFMAGYEIDFGRLKGPPIKRGLVAWIISLVAGLGLGFLLAFEDVVLSSLLIGLALTTTAMGTLLPMLRDRGMLETRFGAFLTAAGAIGEFGPILAITLLLSASNPGVEALLLVAFAILAVGVAWMASREQPPTFVAMMQKHLGTSTQLPVRVVLLLVTALAVVAAELGLDNLLGAFAAGMIARLALSPTQREALNPRLEAIAFGFLVPVFFIVSGVTFDLDALVASTSNLVKVPILIGGMLVIRGLPALFVYIGILSLRERISLVLLQTTALPLLVVIAQIGTSTDQMGSGNAAALVGAGMVTVLVMPLAGFAVLGRDSAGPGGETEEPESGESLQDSPPRESQSFGEL